MRVGQHGEDRVPSASPGTPAVTPKVPLEARPRADVRPAPRRCRADPGSRQLDHVEEQRPGGVAGVAAMRGRRSDSTGARHRRSRRSHRRRPRRPADGRAASGSSGRRTSRRSAVRSAAAPGSGVGTDRGRTPGGRPAVLPADDRAQRATRRGVPAEDGLALGGQGDADEVQRSPSRSATAASTLDQISSASCSTHPGAGEATPTGAEPMATTRPAGRPAPPWCWSCPGRWTRSPRGPAVCWARSPPRVTGYFSQVVDLSNRCSDRLFGSE